MRRAFRRCCPSCSARRQRRRVELSDAPEAATAKSLAQALVGGAHTGAARSLAQALVGGAHTGAPRSLAQALVGGAHTGAPRSLAQALVGGAHTGAPRSLAHALVGGAHTGAPRSLAVLRPVTRCAAATQGRSRAGQRFSRVRGTSTLLLRRCPRRRRASLSRRRARVSRVPRRLGRRAAPTRRAQRLCMIAFWILLCWLCSVLRLNHFHQLTRFCGCHPCLKGCQDRRGNLNRPSSCSRSCRGAWARLLPDIFQGSRRRKIS